MADDHDEFLAQNRAAAAAMRTDADIQQRALRLAIDANGYRQIYQYSWLGVPIIQIPHDIVAFQEVVWKAQPTLIIETGVARGGSVILSASLLQLLGHGRVVGIDIDIRAHNRKRIESHPVAHRIELVEGSSIDPQTVERIRRRIGPDDRVMVVLDSNHTHDHVLAELRAYAPMVSLGQYLVVADTLVESGSPEYFANRPWGPGDNPSTALRQFQTESCDFEVDEELDAKLIMTSNPRGYLRRIDPGR
jgi:cephalosporin hydroxylase